MAERNWTDAQRAAIEDEGGSLLVSAAAGSGKTAVLTERAIRLITREVDPIPADRLLILTFTNAAAEELRARIGARLEKELHVCAREGARGEKPGLLRRQRMLLRRAPIGTMDAFCQQIVKEHFAQLDIPPDIAVGDAARLGQLRDAALADAMEEMYSDADFARLAGMYGKARSDAEVENAVLGLYEFTRTLPLPRQAMADFASMYGDTAPLCDTAWGGVLLDYAAQALDAALAMYEEGIKLAAREAGGEKAAGVLIGERTAIAAVRGAVERRSWDEALLACGEFPPGQLRFPKEFDPVASERIKALRGEAKKICGEELPAYCFAFTEAEFEADRNFLAPLVWALVKATLLFEEKYTRAKLEEKALDFSDFEHLALTLLLDEKGERTQEAKRLSGRFAAVMVDEYQDTNKLQSALYECFADEEGGNLFYVGDVKQSIYRFRKANPGIFLQKRADWAVFESGQRPAVLTLGHNFRSGKGVIGGVNYLFGELMSGTLGDVDYGESEALIQGGEGGDELGFEVHVVGEGKGRDTRWVAKKIAQMVEEGYEVRDETGHRPCRYDDFCILLRARNHMAEYAEALEGLGIPAVTDLSDSMLETPEVLPLRAVLAAIDNPGDDVSLAAALMGPLFRFTSGEVALLRMQSPGGSLWGALLENGGERVGAFTKKLNFYRTLSVQVPVGRLSEVIVTETGYMSAVAAMEGGAQRRDNLLRFIAWATEAGASGQGTLHSFVRLLEAGRAPEPSGFKTVKGHVSIMTIHKSKGLEFPVCILADASHRFNKRDLSDSIQMHAGLGIGLKQREGSRLRPTLPLLAIRQQGLRESYSEEMRVLYVALTRAKDKMIVSFGEKDPGKFIAKRAAEHYGERIDPYRLLLDNNMAKWVTRAALCHPGAQALLAELGCVCPLLRESDCRLMFSVENAGEEEEAEIPEFSLTARPDEEFVARLRAGFAQRPARLALTELPVKVSVSSLTKPRASDVRARPSFMFKTGLTAAERGTAMHAFLQHARYGEAQAELEAEIERLVADGVLSESMAAALDRTGIRAFLASPLAGRVGKARQVLREYDFITAISAGVLEPSLPAELAEEQVLVQGIADLVLIFDGEAEIVDYKTDRGKGAEVLAEEYAGQLKMYREAIGKRLRMPVSRLTLWSFALSEEIHVDV